MTVQIKTNLWTLCKEGSMADFIAYYRVFTDRRQHKALDMQFSVVVDNTGV